MNFKRTISRLMTKRSLYISLFILSFIGGCVLCVYIFKYVREKERNSNISENINKELSDRTTPFFHSANNDCWMCCTLNVLFGIESFREFLNGLDDETADQFKNRQLWALKHLLKRIQNAKGMTVSLNENRNDILVPLKCPLFKPGHGGFPNIFLEFLIEHLSYFDTESKYFSIGNGSDMGIPPFSQRKLPKSSNISGVSTSQTGFSDCHRVSARYPEFDFQEPFIKPEQPKDETQEKIRETQILFKQLIEEKQSERTSRPCRLQDLFFVNNSGSLLSVFDQRVLQYGSNSNKIAPSYEKYFTNLPKIICITTELDDDYAYYFHNNIKINILVKNVRYRLRGITAHAGFQHGFNVIIKDDGKIIEQECNKVRELKNVNEVLLPLLLYYERID